MYFCTAADTDFFEYALQLIGSIHRVNFDQTEEIAVFDLGLTHEQRTFLEMIQKVVVYDIQTTHPDILKVFDIGRAHKKARGWYAWKPVLIKQMLDKYPSILYLDAGCIVLKPLYGLFNYIEKNGSFLISIFNSPIVLPVYTIGAHCTRFVTEKFSLDDSILQAPLLIAGILGVNRKLYDTLVMPMYELTQDLRNFFDDGSCPGGFGYAFSDMTLYSIYAQLLHLNLLGQHETIDLENNNKILISGNYQIPENASIVYQHRGRSHFAYFIKCKDDINGRDVIDPINMSSHF